MKTSTLVLSALAFSLAGRGLADPGDTHFLFKATALFPVQIETIDSRGNTLVTKLSLGTKELVNLALARPFYQAINAKTEVLVVNVNENKPNQASLAVYLPPPVNVLYPICNLSPGGVPASKTTENASTDKGKGTGLGPGTIVATDASFGAPAIALNSLQSTEICASSNGSWTPGDHGPTFSTAATGIIGDIKGKLTDKNNVTTTLDGLIIKGMYTSSGKPIQPFPFGYIEP